MRLDEALHPYIRIYFHCLRYGTDGRPCLPGPGAVLDQDAELMLAFECFEQKRLEWLDILKQREKQQQYAEEHAPHTNL